MAHRVVAATLGPADVGNQAHALGVQPRALLAGGEVDVGLGPAPRPLVVRPVERGGAEPVLPGQLAGVLDPHPPLLGTVHQEQAAERPERLATQRRLGLLVEQDHPAPGVGELGRGDQPGEPTSDHDHVGFGACGHGLPLPGRAREFRARRPRRVLC